MRFSILQHKAAKSTVDPGASVVKHLEKREEKLKESTNWYPRAFQFLRHLGGQVNQGETPDLSRGELLVQELVEMSGGEELAQDLLFQLLQREEDESFVIANMVNVAACSVLVGATMGFPRENLMELGLAGLFHDIGKLRIPGEILFKKEPLSEEERGVIRTCPYESHAVLNPLGGNYGYLAECALQAMEKLDGSGYPKGLQGNAIHPYAQIIGLVDVYEAMTHSRPYRPKMLHFHAIKEMLKVFKHAFHRQLFKALLTRFAFFPVASYVKLNSGAAGEVIQTYPEHPFRPKVAVVVDAQRTRLPVPRVIDLREQHVLCVMDAVAAETLPR
jgi:HD-GYP domain-containing protein (c-di-GMP phosphodiesterase class II)